MIALSAFGSSGANIGPVPFTAQPYRVAAIKIKSIERDI
jgi:hypothetical protein